MRLRIGRLEWVKTGDIHEHTSTLFKRDGRTEQTFTCYADVTVATPVDFLEITRVMVDGEPLHYGAEMMREQSKNGRTLLVGVRLRPNLILPELSYEVETHPAKAEGRP